VWWKSAGALGGEDGLAAAGVRSAGWVGWGGRKRAADAEGSVTVRRGASSPSVASSCWGESSANNRVRCRRDADSSRTVSGCDYMGE
jgi:hypothetical protein